MFNDVNIETTKRLAEAHSILLLIKNENNLKSNGIVIDSRILKGLFFILIYGTLEYVVSASVKKCIHYLNLKNNKINEFKCSILSIILNDECNALIDSRNQKWTKRHDLFIKLNETSTITNISDDITPYPSGNIKYRHLQSLWNIFGIEESVINDNKLQSFIDELTGYRNAIAHGRELASSIGGRLSIEELEIRYNALSTYCSYVTMVFEEYIKNNKHLKI